MGAVAMRCPISGCDYENEKRASVVAHIQGKSSDGHEGIGYYQAQSLLDGDVKRDTSADGEQDAGERDRDLGDVERVESLPEPDAPAGGSTPEPEPDPVCPDCGADRYYGADEYAAAYGDRLDKIQRQKVEQHGRVCVECGEVYA
jgi:hypothetical protein